jgi:hypothetical protein
VRRVILIAALVSTLALLTFGCSSASSNIFKSSTDASAKILRQTKLSTQYQLFQLEITLPASSEMPIILELANGDKVDGYFYVVKGDDSLAFDISANNTMMYKSDFKSLPTDTPVSDRFSFTATTALGKSYLINLVNTSNSSSNTKSTVYFEVIYPGDNPIFTPLKK